MKYLIYLLLLMPFGVMAQEGGVHFEHELSWKEIQAKAKAENKFIFMDCFTTWCGPCIYMSKNVFPQKEMGDFFNDKFINVKVQMDKTDKDDESVKAWYETAVEIANTYGIAAYPTFLYFSPDGKLVHRVVGGGDATEFIAKSSAALKPETQFYTVLANYEKNANKTPADIRNMAIALKDAYEIDKANKMAAEYIATLTDVYTKDNLDFMSKFLGGSSDKSFNIFLKEGEKVDKIMGEGFASSIVMNILMNEELYSKVPQDGSAPDWKALETNIASKYPAYADEVISKGKVQYFQFKQDWESFQGAVVSYVKKYGSKIAPEELNNFAWTIYKTCTDMKCVEAALEWSKKAVASKENPDFLGTHAHLLYKLGKNSEAIAMQEKALKLADGDKKTYFQEALDKMKKGETI